MLKESGRMIQAQTSAVFWSRWKRNWKLGIQTAKRCKHTWGPWPPWHRVQEQRSAAGICDRRRSSADCWAWLLQVLGQHEPGGPDPNHLQSASQPGHGTLRRGKACRTQGNATEGVRCQELCWVFRSSTPRQSPPVQIISEKEHGST